MPSKIDGVENPPGVDVLELTEVTPGAEDIKLGTQYDQVRDVGAGEVPETPG